MSKRAFYTGVTPEAYNELKGKLQAMGLTLQGDSGRISEKGVNANYAYNADAQSLEIDNLSVGFPASMMINEDNLVMRMNQMIEQYGGRSEA